MIITILFAILALGILLTYIPFGERAVRWVTVGVAVATLGFIGMVVGSNIMTIGPFGYAHMFTWSISAAAGLAFVLAPYVFMAVVSHQALAYEHLQSTLSLMALRNRIAALHTVAFGGVLTVLANNVWLFWLGVVIMLAAFVLVAGWTKQRAAVIGGLALVLFVSFALLGGSFAYHDFSQLRFEVILDSASPNWRFIVGFLGSVVTLGALAGLAPFGRNVWRLMRNENAVVRGIFQVMIAGTALLALLRLAFIGGAIWGEAEVQPIFLAIGVITLAWTVALLARDKSDGSLLDTLLLFLSGLTMFVLGIGPAGVIGSVMLLAARVTLGPLGVIALADGQANAKRWTDVYALSMLCLPLSGAFVGYIIVIGYGVQLNITSAMIVGLLIATAGVVVVLQRARQTAEVAPWNVGDKIAAGLVGLQVVIMLFLMTPTAIQMSVRILDRLANSL